MLHSPKITATPTVAGAMRWAIATLLLACTLVMHSGALAKIYAKWFTLPIPPRNTALNLPMSEALQQLLRQPNDLPLESYTP